MKLMLMMFLLGFFIQMVCMNTGKQESNIDPVMQNIFRYSVSKGNGIYAMLNEARAGNLQWMKFLHALGVSYNSAGCAGTTPLMEAAKGGHCHIVDFLLSQPDSAIDAVDVYNRSALLFSVRYGFALIAERLLQARASTRFIHSDQRTILHEAALADQPDCVRILLEYKLPVNIPENNGDTPLLLALRSSRNGACRETVRHFLQAGAHVFVQGFRGQTALMHAIQNDHTVVVPDIMMAYTPINLLQQQDSRGKTPCSLLRDKLNASRDPLASEYNTIKMFEVYFDRCKKQLIAAEMEKKKKPGQKPVSVFSFIRQRQIGQ